MRYILAILTFFILFNFVFTAYASDWDKAGKILTGLEVLRIISGGKIDPIAKMFSIDRDDDRDSYYTRKHKYRDKGYRYIEKERVYVYQRNCCDEPITVWEEYWVPPHYKKDRFGRLIFVEGHYVKVKKKIYDDCCCYKMAEFFD